MSEMKSALEAAAQRRLPTTVPPFETIVHRCERRRRRRRLLAVAAPSAAIVIIAGSMAVARGVADQPRSEVIPVTRSAPQPAGDAVVVTGTLMVTGGPRHAAPAGVPGQVTFRADDASTRQATAAADGSFTITLPPGRYTATGTSPRYQGGQGLCVADGPVLVTAGAMHPVQISCVRR